MRLIKSSILLLLFFAYILSFNACSKEQLKIGEKAPNFSLLDTKEKVHKLSDYKGKLVVIRFWQKGCPACLTEMPILSDFYEKHKKNLVVLAIDMGDSKSFIKNFANKESLKYPMLSDELKIATQKYKVIASPTTYIVDNKGVLRGKIMGESEKNTLIKTILSYL